MLIKCDAKQLEWRAKVFLAQDQVAINELTTDVDIHTNNQKAFGLPSRLIAKVFIFRLIFADAFGERGYDGPAYAYSHDSDFIGTSTRPKFWKEVIERFFDKYKGVHQHSIGLIQQATSAGEIIIPSGRIYRFSPKPNKWHGRIQWPHSDILNYPVQGFSADYMRQVRLLLKQRMDWSDPRVLLINTVHDDIQTDVDNDPILVYNICTLLESCFRDAPQLFTKNYGFSMNIPMGGECKFGFSLFEDEMRKFNPQTFEKDYDELCKLRSSR